MDLENYWQENKKALIAIGCGLLVFLIANMIVDSTVGRGLADAKRERAQRKNSLREERYNSSARTQAEEDNGRLVAAHDALLHAVAFRARPRFVANPALGSIAGQYFTRVEEVRDRLSRRASRAGLRPPDDAWGIEMPETHVTPVIVRHLEALDLIDRVANLAIDAGVSHIARIQVDLDPGFGSKKGLGRVERTKVRFEFNTGAASMTSLFNMSQTPVEGDEVGQALTLDEFEIKGERNRPGHVKANLVFAIVRVTEGAEEDDR